MSVVFRVLGQAGRDNALLVQVDSGQALERLLFDCGEGCLSELSFAESLRSITSSSRTSTWTTWGGLIPSSAAHSTATPGRTRIWGPPETARIMQHRFQGSCGTCTSRCRRPVRCLRCPSPGGPHGPFRAP